MQQCEGIERLLDRGISQDPFMLHGSSIESILELAKTGKLPSGRTYYLEDEDRYVKELGLYFTPVTSKFKNEVFSEEVDKNECVRSSKSYARGIAFTNYLASRLNCQTPEAFSVIAHDWKLDWKKNKNWKEVNEKLRKHGIDMSIRQMIGFHSHAIKRRGVIIEPNESIKELKPYYAPGAFFIEQEMFVECPDGLDMKYISGIEMLGPVEERLMKRFLAGKMKYEGFIIESSSLKIRI
jgi:hypothetical protein